MSQTPLSNSREIVERSLFHSIRQELVDKGYLPDLNFKISFPLVSLNQGLKTFTIGGNQINKFSISRVVNIEGSTGNDGSYTITNSVLQSGNTIITVLQAIPNNLPTGNLEIYDIYDDNQGVADFKSKITAIVNTKGFAIELFGSSNSQAKYSKKVPRIVIVTNQSLPGSIGGAPDRVYVANNNDPLNPDFFRANIQADQTTDITFDIHLVSNTAQQSRVLHGILGLSVPKMGYIPFYNDNSQKLFITQFSYRSSPDTIEGIMEDIYMYRANDIYETNPVQVPNTIKPIIEIKVDTKEGNEDNFKDFNTLKID